MISCIDVIVIGDRLFIAVPEVGGYYSSECLPCSMKLSSDTRGAMAKTAAIAVVVIIAVAGAGIFIANSYGKSAEVQIDVQSTHALYDVSVQVYVDGKVIKSIEKLSPFTSVKIEYVHNFGLLKDSSLVTFKAVSTGGGLGPQTFEKELIVFDGGKYNVVLPI